jgi:hypothetical protein
MRKAILLRRILAVLLCAAVLSLALPSLTRAGGCDDPGGVGSCNTKAHGGSGHLTHPPGPAPSSHAPTKPVAPNGRQGVYGWLTWMLTIVTTTIR